MKRFYHVTFLCASFLFSSRVFSQPKQIYYSNDSLLINETLITENISKEELNGLMQSKSRNGIILSSRDEIMNYTETGRRRYFGYSDLGIIYEPFIKEPKRFILSARFEFEGDEARRLKRIVSSPYTGLLLVGSQSINKETTTEKILADPAFGLIKKGNMIINKRKVVYALLSYQDILVKLIYHSENGHLKLVELKK